MLLGIFFCFSCSFSKLDSILNVTSAHLGLFVGLILIAPLSIIMWQRRRNVSFLFFYHYVVDSLILKLYLKIAVQNNPNTGN